MRRYRPRKPTPEVLRHRAIRQQLFADLDVLQGRAPAPPPAPPLPPDTPVSTHPGRIEFNPPPPATDAPWGLCHCGGRLIQGRDGLICGLGLHDG
jgi:hypothetical protein